jgi:hypothetical protein
MKKMSNNFITSLNSEIGFFVQKRPQGFSVILFSIQTLLIMIKAGRIGSNTYCGFYLENCQELIAKLVYREFSQVKMVKIPFFLIAKDFYSV